MKKRFAVMVTNLSDDSDFKTIIISMAKTNSEAINAAKNYFDTLIKDYAKTGDIIKVDERFHAADEYGQYAWQVSIQEIWV